MNRKLAVRALMTLALMFTLGLVTFASAPKASAASVTCGNFTTTVNRSDMVANNGVVVGYGETLTDGCGNYEQHGHLAVTPIDGHAGPYSLLLETEQGFTAVSPFVTTAPADIYLPEDAVEAQQHFFEVSIPTLSLNYYA